MIPAVVDDVGSRSEVGRRHRGAAQRGRPRARWQHAGLARPGGCAHVAALDGFGLTEPGGGPIPGLAQDRMTQKYSGILLGRTILVLSAIGQAPSSFQTKTDSCGGSEDPDQIVEMQAILVRNAADIAALFQGVAGRKRAAYRRFGQVRRSFAGIKKKASVPFARLGCRFDLGSAWDGGGDVWDVHYPAAALARARSWRAARRSGSPCGRAMRKLVRRDKSRPDSSAVSETSPHRSKYS